MNLQDCIHKPNSLSITIKHRKLMGAKKRSFDNKVIQLTWTLCCIFSLFQQHLVSRQHWVYHDVGESVSTFPPCTGALRVVL